MHVQLQLASSEMLHGLLSSFTQPGGFTEWSMYPEVWDLSHSVCAGFSGFEVFQLVLTNE